MGKEKTAVKSKINWTQIIALVASLGAVFGFDLEPSTQVAIVGVIQSLQAGLTVVFRTWFTDTKIAGLFD